MTSDSTNKRRHIFDAALELFAEQGFHNAPMSEIARRAHVAVGSIYRYFRDKDDLIHGLYNEIDQAMQKALAEKVDATISTRSQFINLIASLIQYLANRPQEFKFLEQYYNSPFGIEEKREKLHLQTASGRESAFGSFFSGSTKSDIKPLPGHILHALAFGPVIFLLRDTIAGLVELDQTIIDNLAEGCWNAIRKEVPASNDT